MDLICLSLKLCAKVFEHGLEPWWPRQAVWREIASENIKKRLKKNLLIWIVKYDNYCNITKNNNQSNHKMCNRIYLIQVKELEFSNEMHIYWNLSYDDCLLFWLLQWISTGLSSIFSQSSKTSKAIVLILEKWVDKVRAFSKYDCNRHLSKTNQCNSFLCNTTVHEGPISQAEGQNWYIYDKTFT